MAKTYQESRVFVTQPLLICDKWEMCCLCLCHTVRTHEHACSTKTHPRPRQRLGSDVMCVFLFPIKQMKSNSMTECQRMCEILWVSVRDICVCVRAGLCVRARVCLRASKLRLITSLKVVSMYRVIKGNTHTRVHTLHTHTHISAGFKSLEINKQTTIKGSQRTMGGWGEIIEEQRGDVFL